MRLNREKRKLDEIKEEEKEEIKNDNNEEKKEEELNNPSTNKEFEANFNEQPIENGENQNILRNPNISPAQENPELDNKKEGVINENYIDDNKPKEEEPIKDEKPEDKLLKFFSRKRKNIIFQE